MEESGELADRVLLQQERQPDMGPETDSVDGMDMELRESRSVVVAQLPGGSAGAPHPFVRDSHSLEIGNSIEPAVGAAGCPRHNLNVRNKKEWKTDYRAEC